MKQSVPGTVLQGEDVSSVQAQLSAMFLAGGLTLSQVQYLTGLEGYTVQNWVRRGYVPPPIGKRYDMEQFCRIALLNALKSALPLEKICELLRIAESPGIGDSTVYFLYTAYVFGARQATLSLPTPEEATKKQLEDVLSVFYAAGMAGTWQAEADRLLSQLNGGPQ